MTTPRTNASHDQNFVPTLMGVSSADGTTPVPVEVDPATGAMLTSGGGGGGGGTVAQGTAAALNAGWPTINGELGDFSGTFTNATQTTSVVATGLDGYANVLISINGTYGTASAVFEGSDDSGTTWYAISEADRTDSNVIDSGYTSLTNVSRAWQVSIPGFDSIRVRSTAVASGTVNVRLSASASPTTAGTSVSLGNPIPAGTNTIGNVEITDGTNIPNILKSDGSAAGQNGLLVGGAYDVIPFTTNATTGAQDLGPYNVGNYKSIYIQNITVGTGLAVTPQFSIDGGTTWSSPLTFQNTISTGSISSGTITAAGATYGSAISGILFRLHVTGLTGATYAGNIFVSTMPFTYQTMGVGAIQVGAYTVGSNSATGSATPANALLAGMTDGTNLQALRSNLGDGAATRALDAELRIYNATSTDRVRSATAASNTTGTGLLGVGNLIFDGTNWQTFRGNLGDAASTTASADIRTMAYNGASNDRVRNNTTAAVIAAGATTTQTSSTITTYNASKLVVVINVSAFTSGTLTFTVNGITSSGYTYPILVSTALGATGVTPLRIFPGSTPSANAVANDMVPRSFNVVVTGTFSATYGVDYELGV